MTTMVRGNVTEGVGGPGPGRGPGLGPTTTGTQDNVTVAPEALGEGVGGTTPTLPPMTPATHPTPTTPGAGE